MADTEFASRYDIIMPVEPVADLPVVRTITPRDLRVALHKGFDDFWAMPTHVIFLSLIYPIIGLLLAFATLNYNLLPILYPLAAGFALLGPVAALGLYELSRRRELGRDTTWVHAFDVIHSPSLPAIGALGMLLLLLFVVWVTAADQIYTAFFGAFAPATWSAFTDNVLSTDAGRKLIVVGNLTGLGFAIAALMLSVVSFPLLLDRHVSVSTAILTSVRAVLHNPLTMCLWGLIVAVSLFVGALPALLGLAIVFPILGHASWHLYRAVVVPDNGPRPDYHPRDKGHRSAADFPVSLFIRNKSGQ